MKGITALGNEEINKQLKKELEIIGKDIQYQEAVLDVLENNENVEFLILSSIIPGQFNIYEFINLIIFKNSKIKIIIFLEKRNKELEDFLISKGINNIYYNNEITIQEIINNIKNNKNIKYEIKKINKTKIIKNIKNKIIKKFIKLNVEPGNAVELGCGAGRDTVCLIKNNWNVLAIDRESVEERIAKRLNNEELEKFRFQKQNFESLELEKSNLIVANYCLPFCNKNNFKELWNKINNSILKDGYFVGNFFGINDEWKSTKEDL